MNCGPCLELVSAVSWSIIPYMIDDVFDLTIDHSFILDSVSFQRLQKKKRKAQRLGKIYEQKSLV